MTFDVGIIGLGAMGSAAAWALSARGASVIGLEQFSLGHNRGSSHGRTRIIRRIYSEGSLYTGLIEAAYEGWAAIGRQAGRDFLDKTGGLDISLSQGGIFEDALAAAMQSGQPFEVLEGVDLETRFAMMDLGGRGRGVFNADAGLIDSDEATQWMRQRAVEQGARLLEETPVNGWSRTQRGFEIETDTARYPCRKLIIAAGAWVGELVPALAPVIIPERQVIGWYHADERFDDMPIFQLESEDRERFYVFPPHGGHGIKAGLYNHRRERGMEHVPPRGVDEADLALLERGLSLCLPDIRPEPVETMECRFTNAPGDRFVIGTMPQDNDLIILSPCSGHGYKFTPAIGEIAADLALEQETRVDIEPFSLQRVL
ncbi:MAG: N-methyl-L-tryptophan oxidase [Alphaproteobacteria bacterium]|nr:N-methyl-L-tryptophan oxidase [Alphaproteobacteria bacterium]